MTNPELNLRMEVVDDKHHCDGMARVHWLHRVQSLELARQQALLHGDAGGGIPEALRVKDSAPWI